MQLMMVAIVATPVEKHQLHIRCHGWFSRRVLILQVGNQSLAAVGVVRTAVVWWASISGNFLQMNRDGGDAGGRVEPAGDGADLCIQNAFNLAAEESLPGAE